MKYLIYELFSGVGFCNQLFSLETAIYLSNLLDRKLILLIRHPLCHWGGCSWNYGKFLGFFDSSVLKEVIKNGYEVHYNHINVNSKIQKILENDEIYEVLDVPNRFSHIGFIDKQLDIPANANNISLFLRGRTKYIFDKDRFQKEYLYVDKSNAARCFTNFYTTAENYKMMARICQCLTQLNPYLENLIKKLNFKKENSLAVHFRFGDRKHSSEFIDIHSLGKYDKFIKKLEHLKMEGGNLYIMADRKDSKFLERLKEKYELVFVSDIVSRVVSENENDVELVKYLLEMATCMNKEVVHFLLEMAICIRSNIFIGYEGSTVSYYIHYNHFLKGSRSYEYTERTISFQEPFSWIKYNIYGPSITWKVFFPDNILGIIPKIITLTNDGYMKLTENLLISMRSLGLESKLKIYCIGNKSYSFFKSNYPNNEIINIESDEDMNNFIEYRSMQNTDLDGKKRWAKITSYKIHVIHLELIEGNDVIFTDGDIVFHKNPIPYLLENIGEHELLIQNDETEDRKRMCSGFFLMKSNENTIRITDINQINMRAFPNDQQYLRSVRTNHKFLPLDLFPHGLHFRQKRPQNPYIVHFNYDVGMHKIERMKRFGVWYLDHVSDTVFDPNKSELNTYLKDRNVKIKQGYISDMFHYHCIFDKELKTLLKNRENCRNVLQIGFLAGHSAEYFLNISKLIQVTSIDIGGFQSVQAGNKYIQEKYPNRTELKIGKSCDILEDMLSKKQVFNIILIDGSFDYNDIKKDIESCKHFSNKDTILIMNNVLKDTTLDKYWTKDFSKVWDESLKCGLIEEKCQIDCKVGRGFAFGNYIF